MTTEQAHPDGAASAATLPESTHPPHASPGSSFVATIRAGSDVLAILTLGLLVAITRWPFRTQYLYDWDVANFALGMRDFNVVLHQPHPPGYPYVVALGALLQQVVGDANAALVLESVLFQIVTAGSIYLFGKTLFSARAGLAAALLVVTSVTFWAHGEIGLAYPALAAFSTLTAYFAYQTAMVGRDRLWACVAAYAVGSGFRPDLALFLLPLLAIACWKQPVRRVVATGVLAGSGIMLWLAPTALLSGGIDDYWAALSAYLSSDVVERYAPTALGLEGLLVNVRDTAAYLFYALYAEVGVVVGGVALLVRQRPRGSTLLAYLFLLAWAAPMTLFYLLLHIGNPGYIFSLLPAALLASVGGWHHWLSDRNEHVLALSASGLALVLLANCLIFFLHDRPLTLKGVQTADRSVAAKIDYLTATYRPEEALVLTYNSYKQLRYYLPNWQNMAWVDTKSRVEQRVAVPNGVRWAIFTDPSVFALVQGLSAEAELLDADTWAARLAVSPGQTLVYNGARIQVASR